MDIVRTFRREGELWGETSDGDLVKWDGIMGRWGFDAPETSEPINHIGVPPILDPNVYAVPHFGAEAKTTNGSGLGGATSAITELPPYAQANIHDPDHPINKWWNLKFPPLSWKRWAFLVAVLPVIAAMVELYRHLTDGRDLSLGRYLFAVLGGWGILTVVFVFGRRRIQGLKPRTLSNHLLDLGISTVILFLGFLVMDAVITDGLNTFSTLVSLGSAAFIAVVLHFRLYGLGVAFVVAAGGGVVAFFLNLFSLVWGQETSFLYTWLLISGLGVLGAIPFTIQLHRRTKSLEGIPTYAISTLIAGSFIFIALCMTFISPAEDVQAKERPSSAESAQPRTLPNQPQSTITGAPSRELAGRQLYEAWGANSPTTGRTLARDSVVGELFLIPYSGQPFKGCGNYQVIYNVCVIETEKDLLLLATDQAGVRDGRSFFYVQLMLHVPLDTEVAYFPTTSASPAR